LLPSHIDFNLQNVKFLPNEELDIFPESQTELAVSVHTFKQI
jgi:hypothetical protein